MLELCGVAQRHLSAAGRSVPSAVLGRCYFDMPAVAVVTEGAPSMVNCRLSIDPVLVHPEGNHSHRRSEAVTLPLTGGTALTTVNSNILGGMACVVADARNDS